MSQTQNVTQPGPSTTVTAQSINLVDLTGVSALWTYAPGSSLVLTGIQFVTPRSGVTWNNGRGGQTVSCGSRLCSAAGDDAVGVLANAFGTFAFNFQTFGYWLAQTSLPANMVAGISTGNRTAIGGIPQSGSATYAGVSGGLYISPAGVIQEHAAVIAAVVDFDPLTRTLDFSTSGTTTRLWDSGGAASTPTTTLDMSGQLTIDAATNRFTGSVITGPVSSPGMTGTVTGMFYGPGAEEIGGTFELTSPTDPIESITGSFGGKR